MDRLTEIPLALSIKQPWADLIIRGEKTIEVREWRINLRGAVLIHVSKTIDWKTVELFDYPDTLSLSRGGLLAVAEIVEVIEFTRKSWLDLMPRHRVVHPPVREPLYGAVLGQILPLRQRIPCSGKTMLFPIPPAIEARTRLELISLGLMESSEHE
jgi:hypothetical protein